MSQVITQLSAEEIKKKVIAIRILAQKGDKTLHDIRGMDLEFYEMFPKLFDAAADKTFPMTFLNAMLLQLKELKSNNTTIDDADALIYGQLRETYIEPTFPSASASAT